MDIIMADEVRNFYDTLNELSDQEFEDVVYGSDLPLSVIDDVLDKMGAYLEDEE